VDIDLLTKVAGWLGFTYEIVEMTTNDTRTMNWDARVVEVANTSDLVVGEWYQTLVRTETVISFISGEGDASRILVAPAPSIDDPPFAETLWSFLRPFTAGVWGSIVALTVIWGCVIWFSERFKHEDYNDDEWGSMVSFSVYEIASLFVAIGGPQPVTRTGKVLTICLGFTVVVLTASYTANLASFLTIKAQKNSFISNLDDALNKGLKICVNPLDITLLKTLYPRSASNLFAVDGINTGTTLTAANGLYAQLGSSCDAIILDRSSNRVRASNLGAAHCNYVEVGDTLVPETTHWLTNHDSPCINRAFAHALTREIGTRQALFQKYSPVLTCDNADVGNHSQLNVNDLSGLFLANAAVLLLACGFKAGKRYFYGSSQPRDQAEDAEESATSTPLGEEKCRQKDPKDQLILLSHSKEMSIVNSIALLQDILSSQGQLNSVGPQAEGRPIDRRNDRQFDHPGSGTFSLGVVTEDLPEAEPAQPRHLSRCCGGGGGSFELGFENPPSPSLNL